MALDADVIVVGAGLAGLVATTELADAGRKVILLDQEARQSMGGQAFWSFGGLFLVNSPEQRRLRIKDSAELAWQDWVGAAGFDRDEDYWPRKWAAAYVEFAAGEKRAWLHEQGVRFFPVVGWAERGGYLATGHGNSVPRFHVTWGTGPSLLEPFVRRVCEAEANGLVTFGFRHRVDELTVTNGAVTGVRGALLEASGLDRGQSSSRVTVGEFDLRAAAVIVASGGIGGNHALVRDNWPTRLGTPPRAMVAGVPAHVDGRMLGITQRTGGHLINQDRMWHYTEGLHNWNPIWPNHGIRILPGPSSVWLDARGQRLPAPLFPGFDTLGTLEHILKTGFEYSWFVLNRRIIEKEFTLSGSEQNPDLTNKSLREVLGRTRGGAPGPVAAFLEHGVDFVQAPELSGLVAKMNGLVGTRLLDSAGVQRQIEARDREIDNRFSKDLQITAIRGARQYFGDKLIRVVSPHRILDPKAGPLIAVRLNILTRKSLGGLETDLDARVLKLGGEPLAGVYAAGEAAGFGGGGIHGYRSLEGTFLGGCIFSGRTAGRAAAAAVR
jgi:predicted oxidoreductase